MRRRTFAFFLLCMLAPLKIHASTSDTLTLVFVGDVMQHGRQLEYALKDASRSQESDSYDYSSYFSHIRTWLDEADLAVANMEFTVGSVPYSGYPNFSAPASLVEEAVRSGFDLFLCANNHICDKGGRGLDSTYSIYSRKGLDFTGLYSSPEEQERNYPFILTLSGIRLAFINFTYGTNGIPAPPPFVVNRMDSTAVKQAIRKAHRAHCDYVIALPHWGIEYRLAPSGHQKKWKDLLIREGVDAIIGSHPHTIQPLEIEYQGDRIAHITLYSLGNYISNMSAPNTQVGLLFRLKLVKNAMTGKTSAVDFESVPLWCGRGGRLEENYTTVPILEYLDREDSFLNKAEYQKMKNTYNHLKHIIIYDR